MSDQLPPVKFSTVRFPDDELTFYGLITDDETKGYIIGTIEGVKAAHAALTRLLETGKPDEEVHHLDERLGHLWLSVNEAAERFDVPADTVRYAARNGFISGVKQAGKRGDYRFPQRYFLHWLARVYRPKSS
jgi:excisionase family DNA binding protein